MEQAGKRLWALFRKEWNFFFIGLIFLINILNDVSNENKHPGIQYFLGNQILPLIIMFACIFFFSQFGKNKKYLLWGIGYIFVFKGLEFSVVILALLWKGVGF